MMIIIYIIIYIIAIIFFITFPYLLSNLFCTVLQIADQLINRVNTLHEKSIIHRDIKPVSTYFECCQIFSKIDMIDRRE